ncbi:hypothetical protein M3Y95_00973200 [Aphelenchoides besseyi]|nr:hypothetical protein M3Y95_00973200 [Aphelenchoides besseyi]
MNIVTSTSYELMNSPPCWLMITNAIETTIRKILFHRNLVFMIAHLATGYFFLNFSRLLICAGSFVDPRINAERSIFLKVTIFRFAEITRCCSAFFEVTCLLFVILERVMATTQLKSYENKNHTRILWISVVFSWGCGILFAYLSLHSVCTFTVACIFICVELTVIATAFSYVYLKNRAHLQRSLHYVKIYTLSQKFQINENTRVLSIFVRSLFAFCVCMPLVVATFCYSIFIDTETGSTVYFVRTVTNMSATFFSLVVVNLAISSTHLWRQEFARHLRIVAGFFHLRSRYITPLKTKHTIVSTDGVQLAFNIKQEPEIYFSQLQVQWN